MGKYTDLTHNKGRGLTQQRQEQGNQRLMSINLLKRQESSVYSFRLTVDRIREYITSMIRTIDNYRDGRLSMDLLDLTDSDFDMDD